MGQKTYLFDFDGTLVDSMPYWSEKMLSILREFNVSYPPDIIKTIATLGDEKTAIYFREKLGVPLTVSEMIRRMDDYAMEKYRTVVPVKEGVTEYLVRLKGEGYSLNVLTASPHRMVDMCLRRLGLYELFDNVWSTDDFGLTKKETALFDRAAERLGRKNGDVVFFDDNYLAISTAARAGMYTVAVYDPSAEDFTEDLRKTADRYVESFVAMEPI